METCENKSVLFSMSTAGYTPWILWPRKKIALTYCALKDEKNSDVA